MCGGAEEEEAEAEAEDADAEEAEGTAARLETGCNRDVRPARTACTTRFGLGSALEVGSRKMKGDSSKSPAEGAEDWGGGTGGAAEMG